MCEQVAREAGLRRREFSVRCGTQFVATLGRNPWIWDVVTSQRVVMSQGIPHTELPTSIWIDSRVRQIVAQALRRSPRRRLVDALQDQGVLEVAMNDWYQMAAWFFQSTRSALRMIAFEEEIPSFWLTSAGSRYFGINKQLASNSVEVKRIYVINLALAATAPEIFRTMVGYISEQAAAGISCRVMDRNAFSETLRLNCSLFGVQDVNNVALFSRDGIWVTLVRERNFVNEAIDIYEQLFHSPECISLSRLRRYLSK